MTQEIRLCQPIAVLPRITLELSQLTDTKILFFVAILEQGNESDYEKILSDLDSNIRKAELRLSAIKIREKRFAGLWLVYSVLAWVGYAAVFAFYLHHEYADETQTWALAFAPIALGFPMYVDRAFFLFLFGRHDHICRKDSDMNDTTSSVFPRRQKKGGRGTTWNRDGELS